MLKICVVLRLHLPFSCLLKVELVYELMVINLRWRAHAHSLSLHVTATYAGCKRIPLNRCSVSTRHVVLISCIEFGVI